VEKDSQEELAKRHNGNLHGGNSMIVRLLEYIVGRQNGTFSKPTDPLSFRKNNSQKPNQNSTYGFTAYSHDLVNYDSNPYENPYGSKAYENQTLHQRPDNSLTPYKQRAESTIGQGNSSNPTLEKMTRSVKLAEFERLLFQIYREPEAQVLFNQVHAEVYNFNNESSLNHHLKFLRDLEKKLELKSESL
jgi:hypothetical protein